MKSRLLLATVVVVAAQATAPAKAADAPSAPEARSTPEWRAEFVEPSSPETLEIRALAERAISRVAISLVTEGSQASARDGAARALDQCHLRNLPAKQPLADMPRITALKRTSYKLRDPANAPDPADQMVLRLIKRGLDDGEPPPKLIMQHVELPDGTTEWRVSRPIAVAPQCVACHGTTDDQSPEIRATLKTRYPADQAVDYSIGEWRGIIRVSVAPATSAKKS